ncbi:MAG: NifU family protein [Algisphaera sp.]
METPDALDTPDAPDASKPSAPLPPDAPLHDRAAQVIELIRPAIQADGGDVELVAVSDQGQADIRFHGACVGCPSSKVTLYHGIERALRDRIPEITGVKQVD